LKSLVILGIAVARIELSRPVQASEEASAAVMAHR
jgi:hypothetical protein